MEPIKRRPVPARTSGQGPSSQPLIQNVSAQDADDPTASSRLRHTSSQRSGAARTDQILSSYNDSYQSLVDESATPADLQQLDGDRYAKGKVHISEKGYKEHKTQQHFIRVWTWELLALSLAVGLMIAKVVILTQFQDQELPNWPLSINLNTLIALLSILQRASLLLIIAEIVGQTKWLWFTDRSRPLLQLQDFDEANRSALGALRLMFVGIVNSARTSLKCVVLLATWITVLSFAIGPFTQQAINTKPCRRLLPGSRATVPISHYAPGSADYYRVGAGLFEAAADLKGAMIKGLTTPGGSDTAIRAHCPSGDCSFPDHGTKITYSSIAICSECLNSSSLFRPPSRSGKNYTLVDGEGIRLESEGDWITAWVSDLDYAETLFTKQFASVVSHAIANVSIMTFSAPLCPSDPEGHACEQKKNWTGIANPLVMGAQVISLSCTLYPCIKSYNGFVKGGKLQEEVVSTELARVNMLETPSNLEYCAWEMCANHTALQTPCVVDDTWYTSNNISQVSASAGRTLVNMTLDGSNITAPEQCLYRLYGAYSYAIKSYVSDLLYGSCLWNARQGLNVWCVSKWWLAPLYKQGHATVKSLTQHIEGMALAITNEFRNNGNADDSGVHGGSMPAESIGQQYEMTVCTTFDWPWLLMPIVLITATALLLAWILLQNKFLEREQPVWKGSVLPLMLYGIKSSGNETSLRGDTENESQLSSFAEIKDRSRRMEVQFSHGTEGLSPGFYSPGMSRKHDEP